MSDLGDSEGLWTRLFDHGDEKVGDAAVELERLRERAAVERVTAQQEVDVVDHLAVQDDVTVLLVALHTTGIHQCKTILFSCEHTDM